MSKYRSLVNGEKAIELDSPVQLIIKTKCPTKWVIEDLETGQRYRANGETEIGPNAVPVDSPESYDSFIKDIPTVLSKITDIVTGSAKRLLLNPEFISLVSKEFHSSISKSAMVERVRKFIPNVKPENFSNRGTSGIRTPVISPQGDFVSDMIEIDGKNSFHIVLSLIHI